MKKLWILGVLLTSILSAQQYSIFYKEIRADKRHGLSQPICGPVTTTEGYKQFQEEISDINSFGDFSYQSVVRVDNEKSLYYPLDEIGSDFYEKQSLLIKDSTMLRARLSVDRDYEIVYVDLLKKEKISSEVRKGNKYLIHEALDELHWIADDSTRVINGYSCKVALLNQNNCTCDTLSHLHYDEIWYTEEVPGNIGPFGYWGLPGLVVEVITNYRNISFDRIEYSLDDVEVVPPNEGERMERFLLNNDIFLNLYEN